MIFERAKQQQPALGRILKIAVKNVKGNLGEDFHRLNIVMQSRFEPFLYLVSCALCAQHFPVEIIFGREVAKDHGFRDAGSIGYLTRGHAIEAVAAEELSRDFENLLLAIR